MHIAINSNVVSASFLANVQSHFIYKFGCLLLFSLQLFVSVLVPLPSLLHQRTYFSVAGVSTVIAFVLHFITSSTMADALSLCSKSSPHSSMKNPAVL